MQEYLTFLSFKGKNTVLTPQKYAKNHLTNLTAPNLVVKDTEHRYLYSSNRLLKQDWNFKCTARDEMQIEQNKKVGQNWTKLFVSWTKLNT